MGFETLQQLPSHNLQIPEYRPIPVPPPPVYDLTPTINQLNQMAQYMSPDARAMRKAAVAKANYEYRLYTTGDPMMLKYGPFMMPRLAQYKANMEKSQLQKKLLEQRLRAGAGEANPDAVKAQQRALRHGGVDMQSESTPPPANNSSNNVTSGDDAALFTNMDTPDSGSEEENNS